MRDIDILIHLLTIVSGFIATILGWLLYLKYRIKMIVYYTMVIFSTSLMVTTTGVISYLSLDTDVNHYSLLRIIIFAIYELFMVLMNYNYSLFALGIINIPFTVVRKVLAVSPSFLILLQMGITYYYNGVKEQSQIHPWVGGLYFWLIVSIFFLTLVIYSIRIAVNLKGIENPDLSRAIKTMILLIAVYVPIQIVVFDSQPIIIRLYRNIFHLLVNTISILLAAKYFFIQTPSIIDQIEINEHFCEKFAITSREKEVIGLLLNGLSIKEISGKLDRSLKTIDTHVYNIYQKTGVHSKMELLNIIKDIKF